MDLSKKTYLQRVFYGARQPPSRKNFQNWENTFIIKKKHLESIKIFQGQKKLWNREKNYRIEKKKFKIKKNISESRKNFRIEKNIPESRKIFQNWENCFRLKKYFVRRIEKKTLELNVSTTFCITVLLHAYV